MKVDKNNLVSTDDKVEKFIAKGNQGQQWIEKKFQVALNKETSFQVYVLGIYILIH